VTGEEGSLKGQREIRGQGGYQGAYHRFFIVYRFTSEWKKEPEPRKMLSQNLRMAAGNGFLGEESCSISESPERDAWRSWGGQQVSEWQVCF